MTIKEAISWLVSIAEYAGKDDISIYKEDAEAIELALESMDKCQKIEQIINEWQNQNDPKIKFAMCCDSMKKIVKVVKDGNID